MSIVLGFEWLRKGDTRKKYTDKTAYEGGTADTALKNCRRGAFASVQFGCCVGKPGGIYAGLSSILETA